MPKPITYATWNPSDKGSSITLSNGNLNISLAGGAGGTTNLVRATIGVSTGRWYWLFKATSNTNRIGIATSATSTSDYVGQDANSWGLNSRDGKVYHNATGGSVLATFTTNDLIGLALAMDLGTLTFYKNGTSLGVGVTGLSGTIFPAWGDNVAAFSTDTSTTNFGASAFTESVPAGYNPGVFTGL